MNEFKAAAIDAHMARKDGVSLYIDLLQRSLTNTIYEDRPMDPWSGDAYSASRRNFGRDWPSQALTMIGSRRIENLRSLCEQVIERDIPGDLIETGVWRGGACIFMRGILKAHGVKNRRVFVADSFEGAPPPDPAIAGDRDDKHHSFKELVVSQEEVQKNFERFGLLDEQVVFVKGWFHESLPAAPIERLAILRLDGDMYRSTMDALDALYDKVSAGGFIIVDDYGSVRGCRMAIEDFRKKRGIAAPLQNIDGLGVFWEKSAASAPLKPPKLTRAATGSIAAAQPLSSPNDWANHKDRYCIWTVTPKDYPHHRAFDEFALALSGAFQELDGSAPVVGSRHRWGDRLPIIVGAHLLRGFPLSELPKGAIAVNTEQVSNPAGWFTEGYLQLLKTFPVFEIHGRNIPDLQGLGISNVHVLQVGYDPSMAHVVAKPNPDIDLLFYGSGSDRRTAFVDDMSTRGLNVVKLFNVYGSERDEAIARAKMVLNIHAFDQQFFEIIRVSYLLANKVCVVSEGSHSDPAISHYLGGIAVGKYEELADICLALVNDPMRRSIIAETGFARFSARRQSDFLREAFRSLDRAQMTVSSS